MLDFIPLAIAVNKEIWHFIQKPISQLVVLIDTIMETNLSPNESTVIYKKVNKLFINERNSSKLIESSPTHTQKNF